MLYLRISIFHSLIPFLEANCLVPLGRQLSSSLFVGWILLKNLLHSTSCLGLFYTLVNLNYLHLEKPKINKSQSINQIKSTESAVKLTMHCWWWCLNGRHGGWWMFGVHTRAQALHIWFGKVVKISYDSLFFFSFFCKQYLL